MQKKIIQQPGSMKKIPAKQTTKSKFRHATVLGFRRVTRMEYLSGSELAIVLYNKGKDGKKKDGHRLCLDRDSLESLALDFARLVTKIDDTKAFLQAKYGVPQRSDIDADDQDDDDDEDEGIGGNEATEDNETEIPHAISNQIRYRGVRESHSPRVRGKKTELLFYS
jgi:hypothetical protein